VERSVRTMQVSVVVPAFNEELWIGRCLDSLAGQETRYSYEVIVVDNNSTDRTAEVAAAYAGVRVVHEQRQGLVRARQAGQVAARGEIVAHTDADSVLPCDWVQRIGDAFASQPGLVLASGAMCFPAAPLRARLIQTFLNWIVLLWWLLTRRLAVVNGCNFAVRADALAAGGGFAVDMPDTGDSRILSILKPYGRVRFLRGKLVRTSARRFRGQGVFRVYWFYFLEQAGSVLGRRPEQIMTLGDIRLPAASLSGAQRHRRLLYLLPALPVLAVAGGCTYLAISPTSQVYGRVVLHGPRTEKVVALTFDDGPNEPYTSEILGVLDHYGIKATFFAIGENAEYYPQSVERIVSDGQALENHSYDHSRLATAVDFRYSEVTRAQTVFQQIAGVEPTLFRPPAGIHTPWQLRRVGGEKMVTVNWDSEGLDWQKGATVQSITKNVLSEVKPGSIVLLHDGDESRHGSDRSQTVEALPGIIEALQSRGYHFVTVPQMLGVPAYQTSAAGAGGE
jgi:peptidoglycan/xylan/chitin deacetylase (PgdA/CDA1 family)/glycosyltransferase involved in cell wall biosynthesis